jgi:hypothetical protein
MGRKPLPNRTQSISISLHPGILDKLDKLPGSRSKNIQSILKKALPEDFDLSIMEYFDVAIQGQRGESTIMHHLKRSEVEEYLRTQWNISKRQDLWNVVPSKVRDWCYGFILPLEDMISELSVDQRNLWVDLAQNQLKKFYS